MSGNKEIKRWEQNDPFCSNPPNMMMNVLWEKESCVKCFYDKESS